MMELLAPEVVAWSDGGGKVQAARRPVVGADRVARFLLGITAKPAMDGVRMELREINGELGVLGLAGDTPVGAIGFDLAEGRIVAVRLIVNPDKLRGLQL